MIDKFAEPYYTKFGFSHLSKTGKFIFLLIFTVAVGLVWQFKVGDELTRVASPLSAGSLEAVVESVIGYGVGLLKLLLAGLVAAYLAALVLPRKKYARQAFYCAACGDFIGYRIVQCPGCGSNSYTIDPDLATRKVRERKQNP